MKKRIFAFAFALVFFLASCDSVNENSNITDALTNADDTAVTSVDGAEGSVSGEDAETEPSGEDSVEIREEKEVLEGTRILSAMFQSHMVLQRDKEIKIFGDSHIEEIANEFGYELLAQIPMDAKLAALVDKGWIEMMQNDYLDKAADKIEDKLNHK